MHVVRLQNITVNFAAREIFRDLSWAFGNRDRIGLVGANGAGKSTLMGVMTGAIVPDAGQVILQSGIHFGFLPQVVQLSPGNTLIGAAMELPEPLAQIESQLDEVEDRLADPDVYNNEKKLAATLEIQENLLQQYERMNGSSHSSTVRKYLSALGFADSDYDLPVEVLSGGQKKLVALVRLAVSEPDVLLLDEPDNHLDMDGKRYLERFIRGYPGTVVIISHDRSLLDAAVTKIVELERGQLTEYVGNYTAYVAEKDLAKIRQQQQYVAQQKEIARIEAAIARFELWASMVVDERHIKQARSRRKMLDKMRENGEIIERVFEARQMNFDVEGWRGSKDVLTLEGVSAAFEDDLLFYDVDLALRHGDRVGLIGANGAGKSVLFRLVLGELEPYEGLVKIGPTVKMGYYSQEHQTLDEWLDKTPLELVRDRKLGSEDSAVSFLLKMLFKYEQARQPIRTLSGGERSRLQLAMIMLEQPNLLLLDEPTNNLDIPSIEVLEAALDEFNGTILTISHDRYFLDRVVDRVVELEGGGLTAYEGGYVDYLEATGKS